MMITIHTHPTIFKACEEICLDNGIEVPELVDTDDWAFTDENLHTIEKALATLTQDELETMCWGEETDQNSISGRNSQMQLAHAFLNHFFNTL